MQGRARQIFNTSVHGIAAFITTRPLSALLVAVALASVVIVAVQFGGGIVSGFRSAATSRQVQATEGQAAAAQTEAGAQLGAANETAIDRKVNDRIREQTITPELERTARESSAARERTDKARANYEAAKTNDHHGDSDTHFLHERNCASIAELYPGERFARCQ